MELEDYINIILRRKYTILLTVIVAIIVVGIGTYLQTPVYEASAILRIATSAAVPLDYSVTTSYTIQLLNTTAEIATSKPILDELVERLGLSQSPNIDAKVITNTELIRITVESADPEIAAMAANTLAEILVENSTQIYTGGGISSLQILEEELNQSEADYYQAQQDYEELTIQTPPAPEKIETAFQLMEVRRRNYETMLGNYQDSLVLHQIQANIMTIADPAMVPDSPSRPRILWNYGLGLVVGLLGGLVLAFIVENLDNTLSTRASIEKASQLDAIANIPRANKDQLSTCRNGLSSMSQVFRALALNIIRLGQQKEMKVLLISSAEPRQGKSTIAANLACSLAEVGKSVLLIDCDMYIPSIHTIFDLNNDIGLSDVLEKNVTPKKALQKISGYDGIQVLTSGSIPENPTQLISSDQMGKLIESQKSQFDYVLLDTPALLAVADGMALAQYGDCVLWIVRRTFAKRDAIQKANRLYQTYADKYIGLIINQAENSSNHYQYYR